MHLHSWTVVDYSHMVPRSAAVYGEMAAIAAIRRHHHAVAGTPHDGPWQGGDISDPPSGWREKACAYRFARLPDGRVVYLPDQIQFDIPPRVAGERRELTAEESAAVLLAFEMPGTVRIERGPPHPNTPENMPAERVWRDYTMFIAGEPVCTWFANDCDWSPDILPVGVVASEASE